MSAKVEDVTEAMKDVVDPELGINVVDLGLVYDVMVDEANIAILNMTLTSAACPLQDVIEDQTRAALAGMTTDVSVSSNHTHALRIYLAAVATEQQNLVWCIIIK